MDDADPKLIAENVTEEQVADAQQPDRFTDHPGLRPQVSAPEVSDRERMLTAS